MNMVRINITIPKALACQLDQIAGHRKKSRFITEAVSERIKKIEDQLLKKELEEGYKARRTESISISKEFEPIDLEGWDEY